MMKCDSVPNYRWLSESLRSILGDDLRIGGDLIEAGSHEIEFRYTTGVTERRMVASVADGIIQRAAFFVDVKNREVGSLNDFKDFAGRISKDCARLGTFTRVRDLKFETREERLPFITLAFLEKNFQSGMRELLVLFTQGSQYPNSSVTIIDHRRNNSIVAMASFGDE
ncbi:hypothetical protein ACFL16_00500 [Patescibacteria group bacterium]